MQIQTKQITSKVTINNAHQAHFHELEECCCIAEDHDKVKGIDKTRDNPFDLLPNFIEQSYSDSENLACPPPVFVPEGGNATAQPFADNEFILPLNAPVGAPPNIPFVEFNDAPDASDSASVGDSSILMNLILSVYAEASKFGSAILVVSVETTNLPVLLDLRRFQFILPNSPVRNSRVTNLLSLE